MVDGKNSWWVMNKDLFSVSYRRNTGTIGSAGSLCDVDARFLPYLTEKDPI